MNDGATAGDPGGRRGNPLEPAPQCVEGDDGAASTSPFDGDTRAMLTNDDKKDPPHDSQDPFSMAVTFGDQEDGATLQGDTQEADDDGEGGTPAEEQYFEQTAVTDAFSQFTLRDKVNFALEGIPDEYIGIDELRPWLAASNVIIRVSVGVIVVSVVNFVVSTLPEFYVTTPVPIQVIEIICIAWFTLELLARFTTSADKIAFVTRPLNLVDLFAVLPYFVELIVDSATGSTSDAATNQSTSFLVLGRLVRITRMSRVIKLSKHSIGMLSVFETFRKSTAALTLMAFSLSLCVIIGATAVFFAEQTYQYFDYSQRRWMRMDGTDTPFQSAFHAMWFVIVTITTVGYGDDVVVSLAGKLVAVLLMIVGVFVIAYPTVILSANFSEIHTGRLKWNDLIREKARQVEEEDELRNNAEEGTAKSKKKRRRRSMSAPGGLEESSSSHSSEDEDEDARARKTMLLNRGRARRGHIDRQSFSYIATEMNGPVMEFRVPGNPARAVFIQHYMALYAPVLIFQRKWISDGDGAPPATGTAGPLSANPLHLTVQPNYPVGVIASLTLMLHTEEAQQVAEDAVKEQLPTTYHLLTVHPRPIRELRVSFNSSNPQLKDLQVVTESFLFPVGSVTLQLFLPYFDMLPVFLKYNTGCSFRFEVIFEDPRRCIAFGSDVVLPPAKPRGSISISAPSS